MYYIIMLTLCNCVDHAVAFIPETHTKWEKFLPLHVDQN
jgi:hypothetical protein